MGCSSSVHSSSSSSGVSVVPSTPHRASSTRLPPDSASSPDSGPPLSSSSSLHPDSHSRSDPLKRPFVSSPALARATFLSPSEAAELHSNDIAPSNNAKAIPFAPSAGARLSSTSSSSSADSPLQVRPRPNNSSIVFPSISQPLFDAPTSNSPFMCDSPAPMSINPNGISQLLVPLAVTNASNKGAAKPIEKEKDNSPTAEISDNAAKQAGGDVDNPVAAAEIPSPKSVALSVSVRHDDSAVPTMETSVQTQSKPAQSIEEPIESATVEPQTKLDEPANEQVAPPVVTVAVIAEAEITSDLVIESAVHADPTPAAPSSVPDAVITAPSDSLLYLSASAPVSASNSSSPSPIASVAARPTSVPAPVQVPSIDPTDPESRPYTISQLNIWRRFNPKSSPRGKPHSPIFLRSPRNAENENEKERIPVMQLRANEQEQEQQQQEQEREGDFENHEIQLEKDKGSVSEQPIEQESKEADVQVDLKIESGREEEKVIEEATQLEEKAHDSGVDQDDSAPESDAQSVPIEFGPSRRNSKPLEAEPPSHVHEAGSPTSGLYNESEPPHTALVVHDVHSSGFTTPQESASPSISTVHTPQDITNSFDPNALVSPITPFAPTVSTPSNSSTAILSPVSDATLSPGRRFSVTRITREENDKEEQEQDNNEEEEEETQFMLKLSPRPLDTLFEADAEVKPAALSPAVSEPLSVASVEDSKVVPALSPLQAEMSPRPAITTISIIPATPVAATSSLSPLPDALTDSTDSTDSLSLPIPTLTSSVSSIDISSTASNTSHTPSHDLLYRSRSEPDASRLLAANVTDAEIDLLSGNPTYWASFDFISKHPREVFYHYSDGTDSLHPVQLRHFCSDLVTQFEHDYRAINPLSPASSLSTLTTFLPGNSHIEFVDNVYEIFKSVFSADKYQMAGHRSRRSNGATPPRSHSPMEEEANGGASSHSDREASTKGRESHSRSRKDHDRDTDRSRSSGGIPRKVFQQLFKSTYQQIFPALK